MVDDLNGTNLDELVTDNSVPGEKMVQASWRYWRVRIWLITVLTIVGVLVLQAIRPDLPLLSSLHIEFPAGRLLLLFVAAMACEFVDSSLGMGYGTTLTPLLVLAGLAPLHIVPAVLFSECLTGITAGLLHHRDGNVDFLRDRQARSITLWLLVLTVLGVVAAVSLAGRIPKVWFGAVVAIIVLTVGVIILMTARQPLRLRKAHLLVLGAVAAFNKGMTGGGYGPLITSGQVVCGLSARQAVGITSLAEGLTCLVGVMAYLWAGHSLDWSLAGPLTVGALLSVPLATLTVRQAPETFMRFGVGVVTCILGALALVKLLT